MFELSEELTMVRDAAREFAERELKPRATKHDRQEHLDPEVLKLIGELGFWGLTVSEEYGGSGMGNLALSIVLEELNRGCGATGVGWRVSAGARSVGSGAWISTGGAISTGAGWAGCAGMAGAA